MAFFWRLQERRRSTESSFIRKGARVRPMSTSTGVQKMSFAAFAMGKTLSASARPLAWRREVRQWL